MSSNAQPALTILKGQTVHARYTPFEQRFQYGLFMVDVDVDRLGEASASSPVFSVDGVGLYGLNTKDHGDRVQGGLRVWADEQFAEAGLDSSQWTIRLVTFPRHAFYRFAPLSVWFGTDGAGALQGVIYEVNNTFGESHAYIARVDDDVRVVEADKRFHVSPFFDVTGKYRFTLRRSDQQLSLVIDTLVNGQRTHMASVSAKALPATSGNFMRAAVTQPLSAIGVTIGIHYEALKLWLRGAKYRPKPAPPRTGQTLAHPVKK